MSCIVSGETRTKILGWLKYLIIFLSTFITDGHIKKRLNIFIWCDPCRVSPGRVKQVSLFFFFSRKYLTTFETFQCKFIMSLSKHIHSLTRIINKFTIRQRWPEKSLTTWEHLAIATTNNCNFMTLMVI